MKVFSSQITFEDSINFGTSSPVTIDFSTGNIDVGTKIINVTDPTGAQDVATKAYVDAKNEILNLEDSGANVVNSASGTGYFQWDDLRFQDNIISLGQAATNLIIRGVTGSNVDIELIDAGANTAEFRILDDASEVFKYSAGTGTFTFTGNVIINGSTIEVDSQITTSDAVIDMNDGEAGAGVTLGYSGLQVDRGSSNNYWMGFDEVRDAFTVGEITALSTAQIATTQAIATRIDSPTDGYYAVWDDANKRLNFVASAASPAGANTQIQFNDGGSFGASNNFITTEDSSNRIIRLGLSDNTVGGLIELYGKTGTSGGNILSYAGGSNTTYALIAGSVSGGPGLKSIIDSTSLSACIVGDATTGNDVGSVGLVRIIGRINGSGVSTRPIFEVLNGSTLLSSVRANGNWDFQGNDLTNIGNIIISNDVGGILRNSDVSTLRLSGGSSLSSTDGATIKLNGVNHPTEVGRMALSIPDTGYFGLYKSSAILARLNNDGSWRFHNYGSGTFTGTVSRYLAVDLSGNIIEETSVAATPAGSNGEIQFNDNGNLGASANLIHDGANYLQLGSVSRWDATGGIQIGGSSGSAGAGISNILNFANKNFRINGAVSSSVDTNLTPIFEVIGYQVSGVSYTNSANFLTNRSIFAGWNYTNKLWEVNKDGDWDYQDNKLTNIGALEVGASFPTTNPGAGKLWNDAGTIKMGS